MAEGVRYKQCVLVCVCVVAVAIVGSLQAL